MPVASEILHPRQLFFPSENTLCHGLARQPGNTLVLDIELMAEDCGSFFRI